MTHLSISPAAWPTDRLSFLGACHRSAASKHTPCCSLCLFPLPAYSLSALSPLPTRTDTESCSALRLFQKALPKAHSPAASGVALTHHTGLFGGDLVPVSTE